MDAEARTALELRRLLRDNEADLAALGAMAGEIASVSARPSPLGEETCAFLALKLHAWYTALETILERIARVIEGAPPSGPSSHRDLLRGMTLPLADVRPRVIAPARLGDLAELLGFRHFVRHAYAVSLDEAELRAHASRVARVQSGIESDLAVFASEVTRVIEDLDRTAGSGPRPGS